MGPNFDSFGAQVVWLFKRTNQLNGVGDDNVACLDFEECARRPPARVRRAPCAAETPAGAGCLESIDPTIFLVKMPYCDVLREREEE